MWLVNMRKVFAGSIGGVDVCSLIEYTESFRLRPEAYNIE